MEGLNITKCPNLYIKHEDYAEILLQNKKGEIIASALVDLEDLDKVILYRWTFHRGYAFSFRHRMHRVVLGLDRPDFNDHTSGAIGVSRYGNGEYRGCNSKFSYLLED